MRILTLLLAALVVPTAAAQPERYELGQRLKAFEKAWDECDDVAGKKRALARLEKLTGQFFSLQYGEAGRTLDEARWTLTHDKPMPDDVAWATSMYGSVKSRYVVLDQPITLEIKPYYKATGDRPKDLEIKASHARRSVDRVLTKTITTIEFEGLRSATHDFIPMLLSNWDDYNLRDYGLYGRTAPKGAVGIDSLRIEMLTKDMVYRSVELPMFRWSGSWKESSFDSLPKPGEVKLPALEAASFVEFHAFWKRVSEGYIPESDLSLWDLNSRFREIAKLVDKPYFTASRPGDFWMAFPTGKDERTSARLFVPDKLDPKKPVPLVVALHGMGGSEHLFFEGYGDGQIVKLCKERGWLLVSPRSGVSFTGGPPVAEIVKQLSERYPVDAKRVFVVGHSMGGVQAVELVQKHPTLFAGAAVLGSGGRMGEAQTFADRPMFVGIGTKDFSLGMARDLRKSLEGANAKLTYKEYDGLEHLVIVREALPDAFKLFDTVK